MKRSATVLVLLAAGFLFGLSAAVDGSAQEQREFAAKAALINVANRFGADQVRWLVELRGFYGQPQPKEWEIAVYDPKAPLLVMEYWAGKNGDVTREGPSKEFYPKRSPSSFFKLTDLKLDSRAAFTVAEGEARKAKMGFNAVNFYLRGREYSREPVWTLELLDISEALVGKIYISGSTGEVLRTVWFYRGDRGSPDGKPILIDSATPREGDDPGPRSGATEPSIPDSPLTGPPGPPSRPGGDEPDPFGRKPPIPAPPSGGGGTDGRIPPPPVPPQN